MGSFTCDILCNLVGKLVGLAFNQLPKNISYLLGEHNQIPPIHLRYLCNLEGLDQIVKNMTSLLANAIRLHTINRSPRNSKSVRHGLLSNLSYCFKLLRLSPTSDHIVNRQPIRAEISEQLHHLLRYQLA